MEAAKSMGRDWLIQCFLAPAYQPWLFTGCTIQYQKEVGPRGKTSNQVVGRAFQERSCPIQFEIEWAV
jgi:hypothetical protein